MVLPSSVECAGSGSKILSPPEPIGTTNRSGLSGLVEAVRDWPEPGPTVYTLFYHYENDHTPFYGVFSTLEKAKEHAPAIWLTTDEYRSLNMTTDEFFYILASAMDSTPVASGGNWHFPEAVGLSMNDSLRQGRALLNLAKRIMESQEK